MEGGGCTKGELKQKVMKKEATGQGADKDDEAVNASEDDKKNRSGGSAATSGGGNGKKGSNSVAGGGGGGSSMRSCQAERCTADLSDAKHYHRRHKVCEQHAKAQVVPVAGISQRFCQQCSRFHELSEFDDSKRSCRRRLAGHNERRRKSAVDSNGESSSRKGTASGS